MKTAKTASGREYVVGQLAIRFTETSRMPEARAFLAKHGLQVLDHVSRLRLFLVTVPEGQEETLRATYAAADPIVQSVDLVVLYKGPGRPRPQ